MDRGRTLKRSIFPRLLLISFAALVLPLALLSLLLFSSAMDSVSAEIEESSLFKLRQIRTLTDARLAELETIAVKVQNDIRLRPSYRDSSREMDHETIGLLRYLTPSPGFVFDILLFHRGGIRYYSKAGMSTVDNPTARAAVLDQPLDDRFLDMLRNSTSITVLPAIGVTIDSVERREAITLIYPLPLGVMRPDSTLAFFVDKQALAGIFSGVLGNMEGVLRVLDAQGTQIASIATTEDIDPETIARTDAVSLEDGVRSMEIGGTSYSVMTAVSGKYGWRFVVVLRSEAFYAGLMRLRAYMLSVIGGTSILIAVAAFLLSTFNYRPIRKLADLIAPETHDAAGRSPPKNELSAIEAGVAAMRDDNRRLKENEELHRPLLRSRVLELALLGHGSSEEEMRKNFHACGLLPFPPPYRVVSIRNYANEQLLSFSGEAEFALSAAADLFSEGCSILASELPSSETGAFIIGGIQDKKEAVDLAHKLRDHLRNQYGSEAVVGVGGPRNDLMGIRESYIEAATALDLRRGEDANMIVFAYEDILTEGAEISWYPAIQETRLLQCIRLGDGKSALASFDDCLAAGRAASGVNRRAILYGLSTSVLRLVSELKLEDAETSLQSCMESIDSEGFPVRMRSLLALLCDAVVRRVEKAGEDVPAEILSYVLANFKNPQINLESVGAAFGISIYTLSRSFKEYAGKNFSEYITELRMNEARRLLKESDKPSARIVEEIGYSDGPNFMRKFKTFNGITIGEFRAAARASRESSG